MPTDILTQVRPKKMSSGFTLYQPGKRQIVRQTHSAHKGWTSRYLDLRRPVRRGRLETVERVELKNPDGVPMRPPGTRDILKKAQLVTAELIELEFVDGLRCQLLIHQLGMRADRVRWDTARAVTTGEAMTVAMTTGELIPIDAPTLRCLVDPVYAAEISEALDEIQLTRDEMRELCEPPAGWTGEPENAIP